MLETFKAKKNIKNDGSVRVQALPAVTHALKNNKTKNKIKHLKTFLNMIEAKTNQKINTTL